MSAERPHILLAGCGYVGARLARRLGATHDVTALVRTSERAVELDRDGLRTVAIDLDGEHGSARIPMRLDSAAIVYLVPPPDTTESDPRLDRFLQRVRVPPRAFVYISTTAVYGDTGGALVDESSAVQPRTDRARRRVAAEEMTRVWCHERRVRRIALRVPGIYGPQRLPLDRLRRREALVQEAQAGISNRIHVDDLVEACVQAIANPEARGVYNVTDGQPLSSTAFLLLVAQLAGLPVAPQVSMEEAQLTFSPQRLSFLNESRRVSNARMLKHLGVALKYADVAAGIRASLQEDAGNAQR